MTSESLAHLIFVIFEQFATKDSAQKCKNDFGTWFLSNALISQSVTNLKMFKFCIIGFILKKNGFIFLIFRENAT